MGWWRLDHQCASKHRPTADQPDRFRRQQCHFHGRSQWNFAFKLLLETQRVNLRHRPVRQELGRRTFRDVYQRQLRLKRNSSRRRLVVVPRGALLSSVSGAYRRGRRGSAGQADALRGGGRDVVALVRARDMAFLYEGLARIMGSSRNLSASGGGDAGGWLRAWTTSRVVWARERFDAREDVRRARRRPRRGRRWRQKKKDRRLVFDLLRFVIDAIAAASGLALIVIGLGYVAVIARYLWTKFAARELPQAGGASRGLRIAPCAVAKKTKLVTEQSPRCVAYSHWPKDKLHIQLLDDLNDETTARAEAVAIELRAEGADIAHVRRPDLVASSRPAPWC